MYSSYPHAPQPLLPYYPARPVPFRAPSDRRTSAVVAVLAAMGLMALLAGATLTCGLVVGVMTLGA